MRTFTEDEKQKLALYVEANSLQHAEMPNWDAEGIGDSPLNPANANGATVTVEYRVDLDAEEVAEALGE